MVTVAGAVAAEALPLVRVTTRSAAVLVLRVTVPTTAPAPALSGTAVRFRLTSRPAGTSVGVGDTRALLDSPVPDSLYSRTALPASVRTTTQRSPETSGRFTRSVRVTS